MIGETLRYNTNLIIFYSKLKILSTNFAKHPPERAAYRSFYSSVCVFVLILVLDNKAFKVVLHLDCHRCTICIGHSLLCEMTLISLLPNLAESISPAIRVEG